MPQDGSNNYQYPPGTPGIPDTTIESEAYNTFLDDLVLNDLNIPRPVHRGGTGASTADAALVNLKAEKAEQVVTAYLSHLWMPGSFRSAVGATDAPVAGHAFAGICYINEPLVSPLTNANVTVEARDMTDGKLHVRQKTAGVWGAWVAQAGGVADLDTAYVNVTGDTMTGALVLPGNAVGALEAAPLQQVVAKAGDTMTGSLILPGDPVIALHAAPKQYVDARAMDAMADSGMQINGSMDVSQERGLNVDSFGGYQCDVWQLSYVGTMTVNGKQVLGGSIWPGFANVLALNCVTAQASLGAGDFAAIYQSLEGYRTARLGWGTTSAKPITIAFWTSHTQTGLFSGGVRNGASNRTYVFTYTQAASNVPQYNVVTIPGCQDSTWTVDNSVGVRLTFSLGSGSTLTAPSTNAWLAGSYHAAPGQVNVVATSGNFFRITGVVVLPGSQAPTAAQSPLIMRPYDQELATCQRYWHKVSHVVVNSYHGAGGTINGSFTYLREMRAVPTIALSPVTFSNVTGLTLGYSSTTSAVLQTVIIATGYGNIIAGATMDARL